MTLTTGWEKHNCQQEKVKCMYFKSPFNGTPKQMVDPTVSWTNAALKAMEDDKGYKDCVGMDAELAKQQMSIY